MWVARLWSLLCSLGHLAVVVPSPRKHWRKLLHIKMYVHLLHPHCHPVWTNPRQCQTCFGFVHLSSWIRSCSACYKHWCSKLAEICCLWMLTSTDISQESIIVACCSAETNCFCTLESNKPIRVYSRRGLQIHKGSFTRKLKPHSLNSLNSEPNFISAHFFLWQRERLALVHYRTCLAC